jgi:hypothetical protein
MPAEYFYLAGIDFLTFKRAFELGSGLDHQQLVAHDLA